MNENIIIGLQSEEIKKLISDQKMIIACLVEMLVSLDMAYPNLEVKQNLHNQLSKYKDLLSLDSQNMVEESPLKFVFEHFDQCLKHRQKYPNP